jgi:uncharacterized protein (DUF2147 family)
MKKSSDGIPVRRAFRKLAVFLFAIEVALLVGVASAGVQAASAQPPPSPIGVWATENGKAHIQIHDCGGKLCGTIVWLKQPLGKDGKDARDSRNPDPGLRMRKILGMPLLSDFVPDGGDPNAWKGGTIYNPNNGKTYSCNLTLEDSKTLRVRGYVGLSMFGATQVWTRVE